jgi:hypothetical protein
MAFSPPAAPTNDLPDWAVTAGNADKKDPGDAKRNVGIEYANASSTKMGERFPYQYENFNKNLVGQWCQYFNNVALYINAFFNTAQSGDSYFSSFVSLRSSGVKSIVSPNSENTMVMDTVALSRYPSTITTNPYNTTTGQFTCPADGYYEVNIQGALSVTTNNRLYYKVVWPNGQYPPGARNGVGGGSNNINVSLFKNGVKVSGIQSQGQVDWDINVNNDTSQYRNPLRQVKFQDVVYCLSGDVLTISINNVNYGFTDYNNRVTPADLSLCPISYGSNSSPVTCNIYWNLV